MLILVFTGLVGCDTKSPPIKKPILDMFARKSEATFASAHLWDDGIIDPRKTREVVALSLEIAMNAPIKDTKFGVFRM